MCRTILIALGAVALVNLWAPTAGAQEFRSGAIGANAPPDDRGDIGIDQPYWSAGKPRPFAAVVFETAGISGKTELELGYGRPHHLWAGVEISTALALGGLQAFGGLRATAPWGTLRFGPRFWTALGQRLIVPADVITRPMLDAFDGPKTRYLALDADANFQIPLPIGAIGVLLSASGIFGVEDGYYVFENTYRVVVDPPFVGRVRVSYLAGIGNPPTFRLGGLAELIYNPGRDMVNVRLGPAVAVSLTHHLEAVAAVGLSVFNPDEIGVAGADLGQIGLRYRWATGDLWPEFP